MPNKMKHKANQFAIREMFSRTMVYGSTISPRGMEIKESEDLQLKIYPEYPFMTFEPRKYDVEYFKKEMIWKLGANKHDTSIMQHASMWKNVQNPDGTFNSNYGQYWFGEQMGFWNVTNELIRDVDSRRAVIPMLNKSHMTPETVDTVCTEAVGFRIRNGALAMSVHMRSSDQIFGLGTDIPTFAFLYRLVHGVLREYYEGLEFGQMTITAMSSHIYSRHYDMVEAILDTPSDNEIPDKFIMPLCNMQDAIGIAGSRGKNLDSFGSLGKWLVS